LSITILSPANLVPLVCKNCGGRLEGADEAAIFVCPVCGIAYETVADDLVGFRPLTAAITTELAVGGTVQYLAVWRLAVKAPPSLFGESAWARIGRSHAPDPIYLYVPAFTLARAAVQRLAVSLAEAQPTLQLTPGLAQDTSRRPALVGADKIPLPGSAGVALTGPDFGTLSPVVVGRKDCPALAHFAFLAVESYELPNLRAVDYKLEITGEELVFLPAVWDPRYVHDSNWRLLLREFDGQVA
jgi:hypothetical protein